MSSLLSRVRAWFGVDDEHAAEHLDIRTELTDQQLAVKKLQAYVKARTIRAERRQVVADGHPDRRAGDG